MLTVVPDDCPGQPGTKDGSSSLIDEIVREGARRMLAEALQAEVDACIAQFAAERGEDGRRLVVRNGYHNSREVLTSAGAIEVTAPRVNDKRTDPDNGERKRFSSAILPPRARKSPKVTEVLPRDMSGADYVYAWADGIHVNIRLEEHKLCLLVMIGVRADGRKELIALAGGYRSRRSRGRTCCATAPPRDARAGARHG